MQTNELLKWQWAYSEQLYLFDIHDAYWIECAKLGWETSEQNKKEFNRLLISYGVKRGKIGEYLKKDGCEKLIGICNKAFRGELSNDVYKDAQERWNDVKNELCSEIEQNPASATLKIFWFYHPEKLPMYDNYVKKALSKHLGNIKIDDKNFLIKFGEYYQKVKPRIYEAEEFFDRKYISYPRVVDKYLWLCGSGKKEENILKKYESSLDKIPLKKILTNHSP